MEENTALHCLFMTPNAMEILFFYITGISEPDYTLIPAEVTYFTW